MTRKPAGSGTAATPAAREAGTSTGGTAGREPEAGPVGAGEGAVPAAEAGAPGAPHGSGGPPGDGPAPGAAALPEDRFLNRELSWLDFNARVLALAEDPRTPLLERVKFLAIFAGNLDEFFMVRIAALKRRAQAGLPVRGLDRLPPREQLEVVTGRSNELVAEHSRSFLEVRKLLADDGTEIVGWPDLTPAEREAQRTYFREHIFPVLTPLAVDPAHPFPYISGLSLNLAVIVRDQPEGPPRFARVKVPNNVSRFVALGADRRPHRFLPVEELIAVHLDQLFPGLEVVEHHLFRVTRNADFELDEDRDEDLLQALERELAQRRSGPPVRLEVASSISEHVLELLVRELEMDAHDVVRVPGLLDLSALWEVYEQVQRPDLMYPQFVPATHPRLVEGDTPRSVFATLREGDVLVHHPYHSFSTSVQRFIEQAAADPRVLAIKQTLYRTSGESPVVDALIDAAEAGKQVVVLVEVKARFDELANIGWARALERAGCHVVYGLVGLKTHAKAALVVRQEAGAIQRYCHIGTGNYHPRTARLYEDFGLLTADPEVGADLTDLFNALTGYSRHSRYRRLLVAPRGLRGELIERIEAETAKAARGEPALVQLKLNTLVDDQLVDALYRACAAGVRVDLLVRGMCTLRPGMPGLSERIQVRSILGRFLEHSRVFRFGADPETAEFWIGSADLAERNLDRRVEALVRVTDPASRTELAELLAFVMSDQCEAFELRTDGSWHRNDSPQHLQETLLAQVAEQDG